MKYLFTYIFCFATVAGIWASEKKDFIVEGKIGNTSAPSAVFLLYNDPTTNAFVRDSVLLDEGKFTFTGKIDYPVYARIVYSFNGDIRYATGGDERRFYLEPGRISINGRQFFNAELKGLATQKTLEQYTETIQSLEKEINNVRNDRDDIFKPYSTEHRTSLDSTLKVLEKKYKEISMDFVENHPNTMLSVDLLLSETASHPENNRIDALYENLAPELKESAPGQRLKRDIQNRKRVGRGSVAPDIAAKTLQGDSVSLSDYNGKWLLLVFWSPTCDICLQEAQELKQMYAEYKDEGEGFEILAFTVEDEKNKSRWEKAVKDSAISYTTASDLKGWKSPVVQEYKIEGVPENYLITPGGLIYAVDLFGYELKNMLQTIKKKN